MKKLLLGIIAIIAVNTAPLVAPPTVQAATCNGIKTSIDYGCRQQAGSGAQASPIFSLLLVAINFLAVGVGIVVVGGILWGSFLYVTANGNASKGEQAISVIVNSVIALFLFAFLYAMVNFLVPGGLFT